MPLTHTGTGHRYEPRLGRHGSIDEATRNLASGRPTILHLQWEDAVFGTCSSAAEADDALKTFRRELARYLSLGGRAILTIHNGLPYRHGYRRQFVQARHLAVDASRFGAGPQHGLRGVPWGAPATCPTQGSPATDSIRGVCDSAVRAIPDIGNRPSRHLIGRCPRRSCRFPAP